MIEFPEVFYAGRREPLTRETSKAPAFLDGVVGNPPFLGGRSISGAFGAAYKDWLFAMNPGDRGVKGRCDLCAFFFRRASTLIGLHGTVGFVATNTIAQGDTRSIGLQHLVTQEETLIYAADESLPWPGDSAVTISVVHTSRGAPAQRIEPILLNGVSVPTINSRLRAKPERRDPTRLGENVGLAFQGSIVLGTGFTLTPEETESLIQRNPKNAECLLPYLGGEEVNTSPTQGFDRYVISFDHMSLDEAQEWPELMDIVRERARPGREALKDTASYRHAKKRWWQFYTTRPGLYRAIASLERCLVSAIVSKHLIFSFQPTNRIFSNKLYVFPFDRHAQFAVLQSRIHDRWAWLLSASMRDAGINYNSTDCFDTFPFPASDATHSISGLDDTGRLVYEMRAGFMVDTDHGLTKTYNALKDPAVSDPRIEELRQLHIEMDQAVLTAYAEHTNDKTWLDIEVPPYTDPQTPAEKSFHQTFEDEILDHLFTLNEQRAND